MGQTSTFEDVLIETITDKNYCLIVWNDDVNTFDYVAEVLVDVCGHSQEQAEQCAIIIDSKGKYAVQDGSYDEMAAKCTILCNKKLSATVGEK